MQNPEETIIDSEAAESVESVETPEELEEVSDDELLGAIDQELAESNEEEPQDEPESSEADVQAEGETDESDEDNAEPEPEQKAEEPEKEEETKEEKPSDEFGTLDENTPEKTRERFETLKTRYDEAVQRAEAIESEAQQWKDAIVGTGTNPEQFGETLRYLKKVNSNKPEDLEEAYAIMKMGFENLSKMLGKPMAGVYTPLDEHPDLKKRVDEGMLDEADALEIAQARASQNLNKITQQENDQRTSQKQAMDNAMNGIRQLGANLKANDPAYNQRLPLLQPIIQAVVKAAPNNPETWVESIKDAYQQIPVTPAPAPKPQAPPAPNALRPGGTSPASTNMDKEPGSELEAIDLAIQRGY